MTRGRLVFRVTTYFISTSILVKEKVATDLFFFICRWHDIYVHVYVNMLYNEYMVLIDVGHIKKVNFFNIENGSYHSFKRDYTGLT